MIGIFDLEKAPAAELASVAQALKDAGSTARSSSGTIRDLGAWPDSWDGDAAEVASHRVHSSANRSDVAGVELGITGAITGMYGSVTDALQKVCSITVTTTRTLDFRVDNTGGVSLSPLHMAIIAGAHAAAGTPVGPALNAVAIALQKMQSILQKVLEFLMLSINAADRSAAAPITFFTTTLASAGNAAATDSAAVAAHGGNYGPASTTNVGDAEAAESVRGGVGEIDPQRTTVNTPTGPVITVGNVERADRIITLVSGVTSSEPGAPHRTTAWAESMVRQAHARGENVAVVAWHGYQAPSSVPLAITPAYAQAGAGALHEHQRNLRDLNPNARLELVGHSYGSVVVGKAAQLGDLQVDAVELIGSPGSDVGQAVKEGKLDGVDVTARRALGEKIWIGNEAMKWAPEGMKDVIGLGEDPVASGRSAGAEGWSKVMDLYLMARGETDAHSSYLWDAMEPVADGGGGGASGGGAAATTMNP